LPQAVPRHPDLGGEGAHHPRSGPRARARLARGGTLMPTLVGVFDNPGDVATAVRSLKGRGFAKLDVYSPAPFDEIEEAVDPKPSKVRIFTLVGGLTGLVTGYAMTIWMSLDWPVGIGGKPFASIPPYTVIAFELTILFGGIFTLLGLLAVGRLPKLKLDPGYSARF